MGTSEAFDFTGKHGQKLAGRLHLPARDSSPPVALFAHCFTCGKDIGAAVRIARHLAAHGIGVLRFDFTGIGHSEGDFSETNFTANLDDIQFAARALADRGLETRLLIGHSLGGAAVVAAAERLPGVQAVATIAAPCRPDHVTHLFRSHLSHIRQKGAAEVDVGGRSVSISSQMLDNLASHNLVQRISALNRPLLVLHSPQDITVGIEQARCIFEAANHPKSFVALDGADHLLSKPEDAAFAAEIIAAWAKRYLK